MHAPKLSQTKTGLYYVYVDRKKVYLGRGNKRAILTRYRLAIKRNYTRQPVISQESKTIFTVEKLSEMFVAAHANYYQRNGKPTRQLDRIETAMGYALSIYSTIPVDEFRSRKLAEVRELMIDTGRLSRKYVNTLVSCIRRVFTWGVEQELVKPETLVSLKALTSLKRGRTQARDLAPVVPVSLNDFNLTFPELPKTVQAMAMVQRFTGMRPGEVISMRKRDLEAKGGGYIYTLEHDKTDYRRDARDKRVVLIGVKAAEYLRPFLEGKGADDFVFSSSDKCNREYSRCAYTHAVGRAARRAGARHWTPNQLRHLFATEVREQFGLEAAQVILGHSHADVTQIYAERNLDLARVVIDKLG